MMLPKHKMREVHIHTGFFMNKEIQQLLLESELKTKLIINK